MRTIQSIQLASARFTLVAVIGAVVMAAPGHAQNGFDANGQCVGDQNGDGQVTIDEVLVAVNNALNGCQLVPLTLQFRAAVGVQPFACGTQYEGIGTSSSKIVPSDFRFYIHNVRLVTATGTEVPLQLDQDGVCSVTTSQTCATTNDCPTGQACIRWQYQNVALLDFENKAGPCAEEGNTAMNTMVRGMAPPGTYTGVRFLLGVPFNLDHINQPGPSPLNLTSLFWSWQDGFRFLKIDLLDVDTFTNVFVHVGSMACQMGPGSVVTGCSLPNVGAVNLDTFNPTTNVIVADLAALLADSDINSNQANTPPGCESNPDDMDCVPIFKNLGITFADGSSNATSQKFFRVE